MFHGLGAFMYATAVRIVWPFQTLLRLMIRSEYKAISGYIVAALKPANPPTFPTPDAVWQGITATHADYTWTVPSFIEVGVRVYRLYPSDTECRPVVGMGSRPGEGRGHEEDARCGEWNEAFAPDDRLTVLP